MQQSVTTCVTKSTYIRILRIWNNQCINRKLICDISLLAHAGSAPFSITFKCSSSFSVSSESASVSPAWLWFLTRVGYVGRISWMSVKRVRLRFLADFVPLLLHDHVSLHPHKFWNPTPKNVHKTEPDQLWEDTDLTSFQPIKIDYLSFFTLQIRIFLCMGGRAVLQGTFSHSSLFDYYNEIHDSRAFECSYPHFHGNPDIFWLMSCMGSFFFEFSVSILHACRCIWEMSFGCFFKIPSSYVSLDFLSCLLFMLTYVLIMNFILCEIAYTFKNDHYHYSLVTLEL